MKPKITLTLLLWIGIIVASYAQQINRTTVNISFGHAPDCRGNVGTCTFQKNSNKATANTEVSYNKQNNELVLTITKDRITNSNKLKLIHNKLETNSYLYDIDEDFNLPNDILTELHILNKTKIKKGEYLVKDIGDKLILTVKLE